MCYNIHKDYFKPQEEDNISSHLEVCKGKKKGIFNYRLHAMIYFGFKMMHSHESDIIRYKGSFPPLPYRNSTQFMLAVRKDEIQSISKNLLFLSLCMFLRKVVKKRPHMQITKKRRRKEKQ